MEENTYGQMDYGMFDDGDFDDNLVDYDEGDGDGNNPENELDLGSEEESEDEKPTLSATQEEAISKPDQLRMIHLRSHLNQLTENVKHHRYLTEKTREEQQQIRIRIEQLESERDQIYSEIQTVETDNNTSAFYRLRSQHERIITEIDNEQKLAQLVSERLEKEEYELAKVEVERGKYLLQEDELVKKEHLLAKQKTDMALKRLHKEEMKAHKAEENQRTRERTHYEALQERERRHQHHIDDAQRSHEKHSKYLNDTIVKMKTREQQAKACYEDNMKKKMDMLIKLKSDITANRENLNALRARDKARENEEKQEEEEERRRILSEGGNPDEVLLIRKRIEDFDRSKTDFDSEQKVKQSTIMGKILVEEERMKRRKKQQPMLWPDPKKEKSKIVGPQKKKPLKIFKQMSGSSVFDDDDLLNDITDMNIEEMALDDDHAVRDLESAPKDMENRTPIPDSSDSSDAESDDERKVDLAKPEFEGLWDQHKPYHVPKDAESTLKLPGATKMEKDIMKKVLEQHKAGIIVKQVAAGREFQGCPFYSKPDVIRFKDFVVGHTYKKKVTLTNVSYTVNYCKFVDITERLKDFVQIHFDPPGQMSAGLTCEMLVTFKPMINVDLFGEVKFLSQTGPFAIPLACTTKKCDLSTDMSTVEFGTTVIGETLKRTFTLTNKGALATNFEFYKVTGAKQRTVTTAETSLGRLTTTDTMGPMTPDSLSVVAKKDEKVDQAKKETEEIDKVSQDAAVTSEEGPQGEALSGGEGEPTDGIDNAIESPDLVVSEMDDYGTLDGMKVGTLTSGELGPFSSVKLEIIWQPTIPGKVDMEFVIGFSDPLSDTISISALGNAIDVPVWVERQTIDLRICMYDRLYQDTVIVNNRATTALRLKFEVCKELRNHLELLPKTGYIQAQSQFSAQLKFLPRKSLFEEAGKFFDKETGVLEAPMIIRVADQTAPVPFTVQAVVTTSDMEFDTYDIDFGYCTIYESAKTTIKLTNKSILPQEYGFVGLPDYVEVQPNDGFGTLLPLESIQLEVIFSPKKARDYKFELNCKSLINREFKIQCKGVGVHPPLELSKQVVHFKATAVYDVSSTVLHVVNSHTSTNEFTHPVPRIGKGEIAPVCPTSFEFVVPEDAPLTISPSVGTIEPGEKCRIDVRFAPALAEHLIKKEGVRMATKMLEVQAEKEYQENLRKEKEAQEQQLKAQASKGGKPAGKEKSPPKGANKGKSSPLPNLTVAGPRPITPPTIESITKGSPAFTAAKGSLLRQYKGSFRTYMIPCYVASGKCTNPGELPYTVYNTLYLEVHCPIVKPTLVVISDNGKTTLDFGEVSIGQNITKTITIQNISNKTVELKSSILDTEGPFLMVNALRVLPPEGSHTLLMSFTPEAGRVFQEVLEIQTGLFSTLHVTLTGRGVSPVVDLTMPMEKGVFDMGAVLVGEYVEKTFKMQNSSSLSIDYSIKLESLSVMRHTKSQEIPGYLKPNKKSKIQFGTQNYSGQNVFDLVPSEGTIPPGGTTEVMVTFAPDHPSDHYSDGVKIELFGKEEAHNFKIKGIAKPTIMYIQGGDERVPDVESLAEQPLVVPEEEGAPTPPEPCLFTLRSIAKENEFIPASRDLFIGCVRTMAVSQKKDGKGKEARQKNGEFQFDNVQPVLQKGFGIEPQKGMVEAGVLKPVTITWTPPPGHDPNQVVESSVVLTLKGDISEQYRIMLHAMVSSD